MSKASQWAGLKRLGLSDKAAAVIMGHAQAESGCETNRLQGDFSRDLGPSINYTKKVDLGAISRGEFLYSGPNGGGYGWLQWTYPARKAGLYDTAKRLGVSVGSEEAALSWLWNELHQAEYAPVLAALSGSGSIREMSDVFMKRFERPADQSESACAERAALCVAKFESFAGSPVEAPQKPQENAQADTPTTPHWPPRTLAEGMQGADVSVLQAILQARGYACGVTGVFDSATAADLIEFQKKNNLTPDCIAGPLTWDAIRKD